MEQKQVSQLLDEAFDCVEGLGFGATSKIDCFRVISEGELTGCVETKSNVGTGNEVHFLGRRVSHCAGLVWRGVSLFVYFDFVSRI